MARFLAATGGGVLLARIALSAAAFQSMTASALNLGLEWSRDRDKTRIARILITFSSLAGRRGLSGPEVNADIRRAAGISPKALLHNRAGETSESAGSAECDSIGGCARACRA